MPFWRNTSSSLALVLFLAAPVHADLVRYFSGNGEDVTPRLHGPVLDLSGSSSVVEALQHDVDLIRGCSKCAAKIDVVVLRASGADGFNSEFMGLDGVDSVVSMVITDRASAERPDVVDAVRRAEFIWFAGGDQCNYIRWIKGTATESAVESVYRRGGAIGGNSAGLAIQGDIVYDSCPDQSAQSKDVLLDPYHVDVSLSRNFFNWRYLANTITDTHFAQRDRMGRTLVFLARSLKDFSLRSISSLAVDEDTSVVVDRDGKGRVFGAGAAYLVLADHPGEVVERAKPLTYRGYKVWKFPAGSTIDLAHRPQDGYQLLDVTEGKLSRNPY